MAGNENVPQITVTHIHELWSLLQALSNDYDKYHKLLNQTTSPPQPRTSALPPAAQKKVVEFRREALKFCAEKLNRRISKHLALSLAVKSSEIPPTSPLISLQVLLPKLAQAIKTRETFSNQNWDDVWKRLSTVQRTVHRWTWDMRINGTNLSGISVPREIIIVGVVKDVRILLNAAKSPRL